MGSYHLISFYKAVILCVGAVQRSLSHSWFPGVGERARGDPRPICTLNPLTNGQRLRSVLIGDGGYKVVKDSGIRTRSVKVNGASVYSRRVTKVHWRFYP